MITTRYYPMFSTKNNCSDLVWYDAEIGGEIPWNRVVPRLSLVSQYRKFKFLKDQWVKECISNMGIDHKGTGKPTNNIRSLWTENGIIWKDNTTESGTKNKEGV